MFIIQHSKIVQISTNTMLEGQQGLSSTYNRPQQKWT